MTVPTRDTAAKFHIQSRILQWYGNLCPSVPFELLVAMSGLWFQTRIASRRNSTCLTFTVSSKANVIGVPDTEIHEEAPELSVKDDGASILANPIKPGFSIGEIFLCWIKHALVKV